MDTHGYVAMEPDAGLPLPSARDERPATDSYRRRSPGASERRGRPARERSRSPKVIDRYQPDRSGRDDYYRGRDDVHRRRSSPPPVQPGIDRYVPGQDPTPILMTNPLPNPLTLDYQVGFNWFAEWWRMEQLVKEEKERQANGGRRPERLKGEREAREERGQEREKIQAAYDAYKEKLQVQMARTFVQQHKGEEWFKERYDPEARDIFRQHLSEFRRDIYNQWEQDLESGLFDEFTLEGIYKSESNGAGGVVEKEEGETTAANEVLGVGDLLPSKGGDLRDEAALQPTLLIKTIAPTVSRVKMEAFCKEHLGEGEGGFKWLSLSDPNPLKKCHRIGWVILNPGAEQAPKDERGDGREEEGEDVDMARSEADAPSVSTAEKALAEINGKTIQDEVRGDFTCHVGIHEPPAAPRKKALWDLFSAPERIERDLQLAMRLVSKLDEELGSEHNSLSKIEERVEMLLSQGALQPPVTAPSGKKEKKEEDEEIEEGEDVNMDDEEEGAYDEEVDDEELLVKKKKLDLLVEYLRRVFSFCFFCVFESDSVHELTRKCPGGHLRRPRSSLTTAAKTVAKASAAGQAFPLKKQESVTEEESAGSPSQEKKTFKTSGKNQQQLQRAFNWVKTYEDKLLQILEPENVDLKKLGGKPVEEAMEDELIKYVKQEDEAKFRCKVPECTKLFKGQPFWRKHVEKRHPEFYEKVQSEVEMVNRYVLDPAHIAPSRSDANSNGHFPLHNNVPTGTPRGFNLASMPFGFPGMAPNQAAFSALFGQQGMANGYGAFGDDDRHAAGPMRRGNAGSRYGSRTAGPYDRQQKDARNMRWNGGSGRLTPPRGNGRAGTGTRYTDGGAVGPREAVQGRSLKSYEDLDAAGGSVGELNY
ncbi:Zinc finger protein [Lasiodiplodia theobromae]|uniref:Zinc finger protein n=1 Tax=Lasiodiplodia theobromae TaxID=45133 RepID=A0A5N5D889_9PEZI|nr:Zinc finger protein [Lasiodiplodia theobromae]